MTAPRSQASIFRFWLPLAVTWVMMALEGPFVTAVIARMGEPAFNLAAFGVTFAFGFLIEAPVMMLLSASTALASDAPSYQRLRRFAYGLCALSTGMLAVFLVPPVYRLLIEGMVGLPPEVSRLTYPALWILLPWPAAIGYRRFYQGILIRDHRTRLVALGTGVRLVGMALWSLLLWRWSDLPGAWVATSALVVGVLGEAITTRWMAGPSVGRLRALERSLEAGPPMSYRELTEFYFPLALTSLLGLAVHPLVTLFMGRAPSPIESLAVFPVINSLGFLFRASCLAFQEVSIALVGDRAEHLPELRRFSVSLGLTASAVLGLVTLTPLAGVWFEGVAGLTPDLAAFAFEAAIFLIPVPLATAFVSLFRGILVTARRTAPITRATGIEVLGIAIGFPLFIGMFGWVGLTAAIASFLLARVAAVAYLWFPTREAVAGLQAEPRDGR